MTRNLVAVPVYNEIDTVRSVMERIRAFHAGDVLAVDDGSTDGSAEALKNLGWLKILSHTRNLGYGQSLIDGLKYAMDEGYDLVVTMDCDEQHEPALIPQMFSSIGGYDVLSGSRYLTERLENDPAPGDRLSINRRITDIINRVTGFNLTDSFCGFKCYRVSALRALALDEPGYAQPLQFWIQAFKFGLSVKEAPIPRIYKNLNRSFGAVLDDPEKRFEYYRQVIEKEIQRWSISSPLGRTRTTSS
ncbi:MAG: glycosyltransferase family 2 protein [Nitrospinae bacterium]|nr:glycosyltransferase family 2 protein [Nitrospinota bacterium]